MFGFVHFEIYERADNRQTRSSQYSFLGEKTEGKRWEKSEKECEKTRGEKRDVRAREGRNKGDGRKGEKTIWSSEQQRRKTNSREK